MTVFITAKTLEEFRDLCPYGKWTCDGGREVLFNRNYWPILERDGNGEPVKAADPGEWVKHIAQDWFFDDWTSPWRDIRFGHRMGLRSQKTMVLINTVLTLWDLPNLRNPPKRKMPEKERIELEFMDLTQPVPPRINPWKAILEVEHA